MAARKALLNEGTSDWTLIRSRISLGELVIYAEVTFIQLPVVILHCLLLIEMFEFGHNRTQSLGIRPAGSQAMDAVEGDILHGVPQKLQVGLDEGFNCNFCVLLR